MRRRDFITVLCGAATVWPLAARAQQSVMPVIGYLHMGSSEPYAAMISGFRDGLKETGYVEGQNVAIEYRWANDRPDRLPELVADLLKHKVSLLATGGGDQPALAAKKASASIPIVFVTSDPLRTHLVDSLQRPGANLTGVSLFTVELGPKRFGLLRELIPNASLVAVLADPTIGDNPTLEIEGVARAVGQKIEIIRAANTQQIDQAFDTVAQMKPDALLVLTSPFFTNSRYQIVTLANHNRIPAIYPLRQYPLAGGLVSYGTSIVDAYRQSGVYTGRLLKGATPNDLPIAQPTKFELVINLKTAMALGLTVPPDVLAIADEVIE